VRVFISHSDRDAALVREIADHFPPWLKTWIYEDRLLLGVQLEHALEEAIYTKIDYVVLLFRQDEPASARVEQQVRSVLAEEQRIGRTFLLPVALDGGEGSTFPESDFLQLRSDDAGMLAKAIENNIAGWMSEQMRSAPWAIAESRGGGSRYELGEAVESLLAATPGRWRTEAEALLTLPFFIALSSAREGRIALTPAQYYRRVMDEMRNADATAHVLAVSTLSSDLWTHDADQTHYAAQNFEAVKRGASIRRLFVLPDTQMSDYVDVIDAQHRAGIDTRIISTKDLARFPNLEDFVLFETGQSERAYIAHPSIDGSRRILSGSLVLSEPALKRRREALDTAWQHATEAETFLTSNHSAGPQVAARTPPGEQLGVFHLGAPVFTCEEAARARNIPLHRELKTLLLETHHGIIAVHLPGDGVLSLRKVKARLETAQAYLADPEKLQQLGLTPGTVSAVLDPVWSMPHLISRRLLSLDKVMTNNGTLTAYFEFDPAVLAEASRVIVDDFEK
jgi:prolyl-tRNA editing enzyme YbaK/EbsC (Cys-tRNA(Pro) deacylase)